jgi:hypothetical protein
MTVLVCGNQDGAVWCRKKAWVLFFGRIGEGEEEKGRAPGFGFDFLVEVNVLKIRGRSEVARGRRKAKRLFFFFFSSRNHASSFDGSQQSQNGNESMMAHFAPHNINSPTKFNQGSNDGGSE